jgi:hypothetical protein
VPVRDNVDRGVGLVPAGPAVANGRGRTIVLFHDVEEDVSVAGDRATCRANLARMLEIESRRGIRLTYNVVGRLFRNDAPTILAGGHALGFHSHDHVVEATDQLPRVRAVDLQVRGYRPPQSVLTEELSDYNLAFHNFEWLLNSARRFGFADPRLERGIAKIPVHLDDHPLHVGAMDERRWWLRLRELAARHDTVAVGLHDCYAHHWIERYDELLDALSALGQIVTCDALADRLFLASEEAAA